MTAFTRALNPGKVALRAFLLWPLQDRARLTLDRAVSPRMQGVRRGR